MDDASFAATGIHKTEFSSFFFRKIGSTYYDFTYLIGLDQFITPIVEVLYFHYSLSLCVCVCVCLSVSEQNYSRTDAPIWMRF